MIKPAIICLLLCLFTIQGVEAQLAMRSNGKQVTIDGLKLYYEESGNGMPLILLHRFGITAEHWDSYVDELSKTHRVLALDLPGHGRSDAMDTTDVYVHERAAEYILGLVEHLELDSINVMGASSGSFISMYMATARPDLIKKLILIGGQIYYSVQTRELVAAWGPCPGPNKPNCLETAIERHGEVKGPQLERQFYNARKLYGELSLTPDLLATIEAQTLIIHGDNDGIAPLSNALEMHKNIPNSYLWTVPNGGHLPHTNPGNVEDFTRRISEFLSGEWE